MSARVVQRHVVKQVPDERFRIYVVWGPMLEKEKEEDAKKATVHLPDPRVTHFWTPEHGVAEAFEAPLGLDKVRAWDTYMLFGPQARWGETPPVPDFYMHVGKPLPPERRLNGDTLAAEARKLLASKSP
jgi:hypothetical protein